ncbi:HypC/HybG/HupF family hydrogenase formation chaperone [Desulfovibrio sp. OttesenSCG-928-F20]|nr:HypC/HybG/HupF family hydrogenase formation chaperone [Desulfovibrio sp. OttesenSCG-928-M16]MDL2290759.1 HypC/HybG/HupF family hydrogenase formation chaperone [Desulfovibrio sp. OttesenSCG-928-F20]
MCLAVPMKVEEVSEMGIARCRVGEGETFVTASVALLEEPPKAGEYIIVHAGFALRKLEAADAEETLRLLREMLALANESQATDA